MPRLHPIDLESAPRATQKLMANVEEQLGMVPNFIATMAHSTSVAQAYLGLGNALDQCELSQELREQVALTVSQVNGCDYCVASHSAVARSIGLTEDAVRDARNSDSPDQHLETVLRFARQVIEKRGNVSEDDLEDLRSAGCDDPAVIEILGQIVFVTFANYLNNVAQTDIDFPSVPVIDN
ncbi:MAG: peroxidase-related enzyme [Pirellulales bacterium]|nr:peroxidase-related enzyme [Pirellulales bacterium]